MDNISEQFVCIKSPNLTIAVENPITKHIYVSIHGVDIFNKQKYVAVDLDIDIAEALCKSLIHAIKASRALKGAEDIEKTIK